MNGQGKAVKGGERQRKVKEKLHMVYPTKSDPNAGWRQCDAIGKGYPNPGPKTAIH